MRWGLLKVPTHTTEVSMSHANAPLSPAGRLRLARCIVDDGWSLRRAAERFQVSVPTAQRWSQRYRSQGETAMSDRSSRPAWSPRRTPTRTERRIVKLRWLRRWGPARIGYHLGLHLRRCTRSWLVTRWLGSTGWTGRPVAWCVATSTPTRVT